MFYSETTDAIKGFLILIAMILLIILGHYLESPKHKGVLGEKRVRMHLGKNIENQKYVINDLTFKLDNKTHQIDHILINNKGIFVIETKNYSGRIYGSEKSLNWTQVLKYGNEKYKFYNPIKQNNTHIYALKEVLGMNNCFRSIVVFSKAHLFVKTKSYVGNIKSIKHIVNDSDVVFKDHELKKIYITLLNLKLNSNISSKEHIQNINNMQKDIQNDICPRCGEKLIIKKGKSGYFYGCENYPRCKFTKKI